MKVIVGKVVSNKMDKTVTVEVESMWEHPLYHKRITRSQKYLAHTEKKVAEGKTVKISQCRPVSKHKAWKVIEVVDK
jgi:small subunit ribosomal protein S17